MKSVFLQALFELTSDASGLLICLYTCLLSKEVRRIFRHFFFTEKWCKCELERLQNDVKDENLLMTIKAENEDINPIIEVLGEQRTNDKLTHEEYKNKCLENREQTTS